MESAIMSNANSWAVDRPEEGQQTLTGDDSIQDHTLIEEKAQLEAMNRDLAQMIQKMNTISAQGLMLNVDIVSQFDPGVVQELGQLVEDCKACTDRINKKMEQAHQCLHDNQPHIGEGASVEPN